MPTSAILVRRSQWRVLPWRNGRGQSHAIWTGDGAEPAGLQIFRTPIVEPAPFSDFSGFERIFTVVRGEGLELTIGGEVQRARPLAPLRFPGEAAVAVALPQGGAEVLNIIYARARWHEATPVAGRTLTIAHQIGTGTELDADDTLLAGAPLAPGPGLIQIHLAPGPAR